MRSSRSKIDVLIVGSLNKTQVKKFIRELEQDEGVSLNYAVMEYEDFYYRLSIKDKFVTEILTGKYTLILDTEHILSQ